MGGGGKNSTNRRVLINVTLFVIVFIKAKSILKKKLLWLYLASSPSLSANLYAGTLIA